MRPPFIIREPRLQQLFLRFPHKAASIEEYAQATGMSPDDVLTHLAPLFAEGILGLDSVQGVLFVNTAPAGRPAPVAIPEVLPNLWEDLCSRAPSDKAFALWRLLRGLEASGWNVTTNQQHLHDVAPVSTQLLLLGVTVQDILLPLIPYPTPQALSPALLDIFAMAGAPGVVVTCPNRGLDAMVTAVRSWFLATAAPANLTVFVLEAPSFGATVVRPDDNSITPVVVQRYEPGTP